MIYLAGLKIYPAFCPSCTVTDGTKIITKTVCGIKILLQLFCVKFLNLEEKIGY